MIKAAFHEMYGRSHQRLNYRVNIEEPVWISAHIQKLAPFYLPEFLLKWTSLLRCWMRHQILYLILALALFSFLQSCVKHVSSEESVTIGREVTFLVRHQLEHRRSHPFPNHVSAGLKTTKIARVSEIYVAWKTEGNISLRWKDESLTVDPFHTDFLSDKINVLSFSVVSRKKSAIIFSQARSIVGLFRFCSVCTVSRVIGKNSQKTFLRLRPKHMETLFSSQTHTAVSKIEIFPVPFPFLAGLKCLATAWVNLFRLWLLSGDGFQVNELKSISIKLFYPQLSFLFPHTQKQ